MSSLHKHRNSPFWYCAYRSADGKQHFKSTGTSVRKEAAAICEKLGKGARLARKKQLTPDRARKLIEDAVSEVLEESGQKIARASIRSFLTSWLKEKEDAGAVSTHVRYEGIIARFLEFLGDRAEDSLASVAKADVLAFRDELADEVSAGTVNTYLKVLRVAFGRALKEQLITINPAALVDRMSNRDRHERDPFTVEQIQKLLKLAHPEWRTMIVFGLYTGLRLQDLATLSWKNLDLENKELTVTTSKTGRTQILPIAPALMEHIETLPASDASDAPLCPNLDGRSSSWLSNQFYDLMTSAGLVSARDHQKKKQGRGRRRDLNPLSFHALRHTTTSMLKNAGVNEVIARDIVGHESEAVSRNYTHIGMTAKREAINKMPNIFRAVHKQAELGFRQTET